VFQTFGCEVLWCLTNTSCHSRGSPKADGTKCGENKVREEPVPKGEMYPARIT